ncbi:tyrosine-protein kinase Fer [Planoprotostelium fungivorum]|uniref:Tyrosine-protein kinase Fer n=1 Tax=Planoprotostelium fungivorum TaxID=1890364 RepID=A0A2P6N5I4_9EUKA|nr:tyrosine-protein kinase Fer [Planoprotostelium fungivorum]
MSGCQRTSFHGKHTSAHARTTEDMIELVFLKTWFSITSILLVCFRIILAYDSSCPPYTDLTSGLYYDISQFKDINTFKYNPWSANSDNEPNVYLWRPCGTLGDTYTNPNNSLIPVATSLSCNPSSTACFHSPLTVGGTISLAKPTTSNNYWDSYGNYIVSMDTKHTDKIRGLGGCNRYIFNTSIVCDIRYDTYSWTWIHDEEPTRSNDYTCSSHFNFTMQCLTLDQSFVTVGSGAVQIFGTNIDQASVTADVQEANDTLSCTPVSSIQLSCTFDMPPTAVGLYITLDGVTSVDPLYVLPRMDNFHLTPDNAARTLNSLGRMDINTSTFSIQLSNRINHGDAKCNQPIRFISYVESFSIEGVGLTYDTEVVSLIDCLFIFEDGVGDIQLSHIAIHNVLIGMPFIISRSSPQINLTLNHVTGSCTSFKLETKDARVLFQSTNMDGTVHDIFSTVPPCQLQEAVIDIQGGGDVTLTDSSFRNRPYVLSQTSAKGHTLNVTRSQFSSTSLFVCTEKERGFGRVYIDRVRVTGMDTTFLDNNIADPGNVVYVTNSWMSGRSNTSVAISTGGDLYSWGNTYNGIDPGLPLAAARTIDSRQDTFFPPESATFFNLSPDRLSSTFTVRIGPYLCYPSYLLRKISNRRLTINLIRPTLTVDATSTGPFIFVDDGVDFYLEDVEFWNLTRNIQATEGASVTLNNTRFYNSISSGDGSVLYMYKNQNGSIYNSVFRQGNSNRGGFIFAEQSDGLQLTNCSFEGGKSWSGGAIYSLMTSLKVHDCSFTENVVQESGGGIMLDTSTGIIRDISVTNTIFSSNTANLMGGALQLRGQLYGSLIVDNVTFVDNVGNTAGGAIEIEACLNDLIIYNSTFTRNRGALGGGAIFISTSTTTTSIQLENCHFLSNNAGLGGGLAVMSGRNPLNITNCTFLENFVDQQGGAVIVQESTLNPSFTLANLSIYNSRFERNRAGNFGGALMVNHLLAFTVSGCTFIHNESPLGGCIYSTGFFTIYIEQSLFRGATKSSYGGGMYVDGSEISVKSTTFDGCQASNSGGALYITNPIGPASIVDSRFFNCNSTLGSAISAENFQELSVQGSEFHSCTTVSSGVITAVSGKSVVLQRVTSIDNTGSRGTLFHLVPSGHVTSVTIVSVNVSGNTATAEGSAVSIQGDLDALSIYNSQFQHNHAVVGVISITGRCRYTNIHHTKFHGNEGMYGGSIYISGGRQVNLTHNTMSSNRAYMGGAIYIRAGRMKRLVVDRTIYITDNEFTENHADGKGGAISVTGDDVITRGNSFVYNEAKEGGRDIYVETGRLTTIDDELSDHGVLLESTSTISGNLQLDTIHCPSGLVSYHQLDVFSCVEASQDLMDRKKVAAVIIVTVTLLSTVLGIIAYLVRKKRGKVEVQEVELLNFDHLVLRGVQVGKKIGAGYFGEVFKGTWEGTPVALKSTKNSSANRKSQDLRWKEEIALLQKLNHPNIVRLLGVYRPDEQHLYMVLEYVCGGSLDMYLYHNFGELGDNALLRMVFDVAKGMTYLQTMGVLHRDLAARNLLIDGGGVVKISDFGMSRENGIYNQHTKVLPFKWCAPEVIERGINTHKSDVWSFAVTTWEIYSQGHSPYPGMSNSDVLREVIQGDYRLPRPLRCPERVYDILLACWKREPGERMNFVGIYNALLGGFPSILNGEMMEGGSDSGSSAPIEISGEDDTNYEYYGTPDTRSL